MQNNFTDKLTEIAYEKYGKSLKVLDREELYGVIGAFVNEKCEHHKKDDDYIRVAYFSIEYLVGKLLYSNLFNMKNTNYIEEILRENGRSLSELEKIDDYAFGNGGLGRLAACFLDSAASCEIPLDGYGIRYKKGLFRQSFTSDGEQTESPDEWESIMDAFGIKREEESVTVEFSDFSVRAIPYDYNIIGYSFKRINSLRLYECKSDNACNSQAEKISEHLYPDDSDYEGKKLRLRQQYFLVSAAIQNIISKYGIDNLEERIRIQLNDTHPIMAIPELINQCIKRNMSFDDALEMCRKIFAYTNHTVMPEALEEWECALMKEILPQIYGIIEKINDMLLCDISNNKEILSDECAIIKNGRVRMANLACYVCSHINGVAEIHTEILKKDTLSQWYKLYPDKFTNKTNGITQRRWLGLCNKELSNFLSGLLNCDIVDSIGNIKGLEVFKDDKQVIDVLYDIKQNNKKALSSYAKERDNFDIDTESVFVVQIKRIHEYKRQLLAIFGIIHIYMRMKKGEYKHLPKATFIFSGKAAAGYKTAKSIIKFINKVSYVINKDRDIDGRIKVYFLPDYNVSLAEKIIPAADISLQISLAGTEASGTGNMKLMMNGAVTLGTYDGANIEICREAGQENNYIFGMRENEVTERKSDYNPKEIYENNAVVKEVVDTLVSGKFGERYEFKDIYDSLINDDNADRYMVLEDLTSFIDCLEEALTDTVNKEEFTKKCLMNIADSSFFSSDRTVKEYARDIWFKE